jgi:hypothetical protein
LSDIEKALAENGHFAMDAVFSLDGSRDLAV